MKALLIIGDGDFSFSKSLMKYINFDDQCCIISTCYEIYEDVITKYSQASSNIDFIKDKGGFVKTSVDGTKLHLTNFDTKFDTIIFNFPHQGGKSNVKNNRILLKDIFTSIKESGVLKHNGTICISLCQGQAGTNIDITDRDFGNSWQIEEMASQSNYYLFDVRQFDLTPFGDYIPTGFRSQEKQFRLVGARTYIFVRTDFCLETNLIDQCTINNTKYFAPSWISEFFNKLSTNKSLNYCLIRNMIETMKSPVVMDWLYIIKSCSGYKLTDMEGNDSYLCCSPWQQAVRLVLEDNSTCPTIVVSHGVCFYKSDLSNNSAVNAYVVVVECGASSLIESRGIDCNIDRYDLELIQNSGLILTSVVHSTYDKNMPSIVATLFSATNNRTFAVSVINVSQFLHRELSIAINDTFVDIDTIRMHLSPSIIDRIFPNNFYDTNYSPLLSMIGHKDVLRLLKQRNLLDTRPFRDISFWLPDPCMDITNVIKEVDEICRCVFRYHIERSVHLVDDYVEEVSGTRGICLRMSLRSGVLPLSREMINSQLLAVRGHCERVLHVQLR